MINTFPILAFDPVTWLIWTIIVMAISYGVRYLMKKDPKDVRYDPDTFDVPEIKEGTKFPIVAGTCWIEAPIIGWFGDIRTSSIGIRLSDTDGQYVYINKYYYGALHILTQGFNDGVIQIKVGDLIVWPSHTNVKSLNADGASSAWINLMDLYGGIKEHNAQITGRGGIKGSINFQYGLATQTVNSYLASKLGSQISANRGLTTAVLRRPYIGLSSTLYLWKYMVKRTLHLTSGEDQWYSEKAAIRTYEINPIHWLREIYTNTEWGLAMSTALLNNTNLEAAADALYDEGFGICIKLEGEQSLEAHVIDILRYINGVIYEDHTTGLIEIKLIRDDYVAGDLEEFNETDIVGIEDFTRGVLHKIPDVTYVRYWDMYNNLPVVIPSHDMSLTLSQNETLIPNDVDYTGVINNELAGKLAARDQQQLSSFAAVMTIKCKRTMSHLKPGGVFKLSYAPLGIVSMIVRVVTPHYGTLTDGIVTFECMEDIFGMKDSLYAAPPPTDWDGTIPDPIYDDNFLIAEVAMSGVDPTVTVAIAPPTLYGFSVKECCPDEEYDYDPDTADNLGYILCHKVLELGYRDLEVQPCQSFTALETYVLRASQLYLHNCFGDEYTDMPMEVVLQAADGSDRPTGAELMVKEIVQTSPSDVNTWRDVDWRDAVGAGYEVQEGLKYCILLRQKNQTAASPPGEVYRPGDRWIYSSTSGIYADGKANFWFESTYLGLAYWTAYNVDFLFRNFG